jgi:hypothetical protein
MHDRIYMPGVEINDRSAALELVENIPLYRFVTWPEMLVRLPDPKWKPAFKVLWPGEIWHDRVWMHREDPWFKDDVSDIRPDDCYCARNDFLCEDPAWWGESYDYAPDEEPIMQAVDDEPYDVHLVKRAHSASEVVAFIEECIRDWADGVKYARVLIADGAMMSGLTAMITTLIHSC